MDQTYPIENTRRHVLPADLAAQLRAARLYRGLGLRELARHVGLTPGYLTLLEQGKRCPSLAVARDLVTALELVPDLAEQLFAIARPDTGRSRLSGAQ